MFALRNSAAHVSRPKRPTPVALFWATTSDLRDQCNSFSPCACEIPLCCHVPIITFINFHCNHNFFTLQSLCHHVTIIISILHCDYHVIITTTMQSLYHCCVTLIVLLLQSFIRSTHQLSCPLAHKPTISQTHPLSR